MVTNVTSLTGNGLKDWLIQRVTAVYLFIFIALWLGYFLSHPNLDFTQWKTHFHHTGLQVTTVLAVFAIILHTWIGIWTVSTDYIKCTVIRLGFQVLVFLGLLAEFIWSIQIVWGQ